MINGSLLNMIDPGCSEKYLGMWIDPWTGFADSGASENLEEWLHWVSKTALKPLQKVSILRTCTIQRLIYLVEHTEVGAGLLKSLDLLIRTSVKEWFHLPQDMCDALLYPSCKDGGLGIVQLATLIASTQV